MNHVGRPLRQTESIMLFTSAVGLLGVMLLHVYFLTLGYRTPQLLTFWAPLELAGVLVLYAALSDEEKWVLALILIFAAALHLVLPLSSSPSYVGTEDAVYGYQRVLDTIASGRWHFGVGTGGSAESYSFFPMTFIFAAVWSEVSAIMPSAIANYGIAIVNLTALLTLRMLNKDLLKLSEKESNLVLFLYALTPTIHRIEAKLHYEAYAIIFFPLVIMFILKPRLSLAERTVAIAAIISISLAHYFTSYIMMLNAIVIAVSYLVFRGTRIQGRLLFLTIVAPIIWVGTVAVAVMGRNLITVQSVFSHLRDLNTLFSRLSAQAATPVATYYPAAWFTELVGIRNVVILLLGLIAVVSLCISRRGKLGLRISRRDMYTYLAATWIFSIFFSIAAYYGVVWDETVLASGGAGSARNRIAEFSFFNFSIFSGVGLFVGFDKLKRHMHPVKLELAKVLVAICLIILFVSGAVVQAYPRVAYDASYRPIFYDEYVTSFTAPYYLGNWWNGVANHTVADSRPFSGSRALKTFIRGYGYQSWWEDNMSAPAVDLNGSRSVQFTVYYAIDTAQLQLPDHIYNVTLSPQLVSAQNPKLNMIFNSGRIIVLYKPAGT